MIDNYLETLFTRFFTMSLFIAARQVSLLDGLVSPGTIFSLIIGIFLSIVFLRPSTEKTPSSTPSAPVADFSVVIWLVFWLCVLVFIISTLDFWLTTKF